MSADTITRLFVFANLAIKFKLLVHRSLNLNTAIFETLLFLAFQCFLGKSSQHSVVPLKMTITSHMLVFFGGLASSAHWMLITGSQD